MFIWFNVTLWKRERVGNNNTDLHWEVPSGNSWGSLHDIASHILRLVKPIVSSLEKAEQASRF
jgi:hypothetical protein